MFQKECQENCLKPFNVTLSLGSLNLLSLHPDDETTLNLMICQKVARIINKHMAGDEWPKEWDCMKINSGDIIDCFEKDKLQALKPHLFQLNQAPFSAHELLNYHRHFERQTK